MPKQAGSGVRGAGRLAGIWGFGWPEEFPGCVDGPKSEAGGGEPGKHGGKKFEVIEEGLRGTSHVFPSQVEGLKEAAKAKAGPEEVRADAEEKASRAGQDGPDAPVGGQDEQGENGDAKKRAEAHEHGHGKNETRAGEAQGGLLFESTNEEPEGKDDEGKRGAIGEQAVPVAIGDQAAGSVATDADEEWTKGEQHGGNGGGGSSGQLAAGEIKKCGAECVEEGCDSFGGVVAGPESKGAGKEKRKQGRAAGYLLVAGRAGSDVLGVEKIDVLIPEVHLRQAPETDEKCRGREQQEACAFEGRASVYRPQAARNPMRMHWSNWVGSAGWVLLGSHCGEDWP